MKSLSYYFLLLLAACSLGSCDELNQNDEVEYVDVGFNVTLPLLSETPLATKAKNNGIYGLNIYEYKNDYGEGAYCYGLFDKMDNLVIRFRKGYKYHFVIDYIPDAKNVIGHSGYEYGVPFMRAMHVPHNTAPQINKLVYDAEDCLMQLGSWEIHRADSGPGGAVYMSEFERYIFTDWDFTPPTDGSTVSIELQSANAGLTFVFEKVQGYDYSNVYVKVDQAMEHTINLSKSDRLEMPQIAFGRSHWIGVDYEDEHTYPVTIGTPENPTLFFKGEITAKRNIMRTFVVKLQPEETVNTPFDISVNKGTIEYEDGGQLN
jgi:hypothetical protein